MTASLPARIDPIPPIDRSAPERTMKRLPAWLASSADSVSGGYPAGEIAADKALTPTGRSLAEAHVRELAAYCEPGPAKRIGASLAGMLAAFPSQQLSPEAADARARGYQIALDGLPAWAVERAVAFWLRREHPEGGENYSFAPSAPQLRRLALLVSAPVAEQLFKIRRLLEAKVISEPEQTSPERREKLAAMLKNALKPVTAARQPAEGAQ